MQTVWILWAFDGTSMKERSLPPCMGRLEEPRRWGRLGPGVKIPRSNFRIHRCQNEAPWPQTPHMLSACRISEPFLACWNGQSACCGCGSTAEFTMTAAYLHEVRYIKNIEVVQANVVSASDIITLLWCESEVLEGPADPVTASGPRWIVAISTGSRSC